MTPRGEGGVDRKRSSLSASCKAPASEPAFQDAGEPGTTSPRGVMHQARIASWLSNTCTPRRSANQRRLSLLASGLNSLSRLNGKAARVASILWSLSTLLMLDHCSSHAWRLPGDGSSRRQRSSSLSSVTLLTKTSIVSDMPSQPGAIFWK